MKALTNIATGNAGGLHPVVPAAGTHLRPHCRGVCPILGGPHRLLPGTKPNIWFQPMPPAQYSSVGQCEALLGDVSLPRLAVHVQAAMCC